MKCTRCGKEMTIKPVQSGTDEKWGSLFFTRMHFAMTAR